MPDFSKRRAEAIGVGLGAFATAAEVVLLREALAVSAGDELVLGLALALWLLGVAAGAAIAANLRAGFRALIGAQLVSGPAAVAALAGLRLHRAFVDVPPGTLPTSAATVAVLAAAILPSGALVGLSFTAAARSSPDGDARPASRIYLAEALGALVAGLSLGLTLGEIADHASALAIASSLALACYAFGARRSAARYALLGVSVLAAALAISGLARRADAALTASSFALDATRGALVAAADSAYGRLALGRSERQYTLYSDGRPAQTFPDPWERTGQIHLALSAHRSPKRVLLVGGGAPDRLSAALSHRPSRVVLTYLDDAERALCAPFLPAEARLALGDPRVALVREDGRRYVASVKEEFDVVVIASPPPTTARANRYHTAEFFASVRRALAPGGLVSLRVPGGANAVSEESARAAASVLRAVERSLPATLLAPGAEALVLAAARPGDLPSGPAELEERFAARVGEAPGFVPSQFEDLLHPGRAKALRERLAATNAPTNSDTRPYAYLEGVALRLRKDSPFAGRGASTAVELGARYAWILIALPALAWFSLRLRPSARRGRSVSDAAFSIATTGAAGMAIEVLVLYAFQVAAGVVYTALAGIVAAFMAGLALGAAGGGRFVGGGRPRDAVLADAAVLAVLLATGPVLGAALDRAFVAVVWSAVAGAATGAAFPAFLASAARSRSGDERSSAGAIESADHLGAAFGALVTGLVLLPAAGISGSALAFAALKASALALSAAKAFAAFSRRA